MKIIFEVQINKVGGIYLFESYKDAESFAAQFDATDNVLIRERLLIGSKE